MLLPAGNKSTQTLSAPDAPAREATSGEVPDERLLFPELTDSDISEIHIRAGDDCAFDFSLRGELSVNGQKADGEVFSTLLDQLTADCFIPCEDFEPRGEPLLTVTVSTDTQDFSARFYQDSEDGKYAYVVAGADKARCLKTDAWRVGTLLLTCEGTRIFDASGQETPVDYPFSHSSQISGQYPTVARRPSRTMGSRRSCGFSISPARIESRFWV